MKKLLLLLLFSNFIYAQRIFDYDITNINPQIVSPTINQNLEQTSFVVNENSRSLYINKPLETLYDSFSIGGGFNYKRENEYYNGEIYVSRSGFKSEKWRMSINAGYYTLKTYDYSIKRNSFYLGGSLSYHPNENNYFGISIKDLNDVTTSNVGELTDKNKFGERLWGENDEKIYYLFEAMTPTVFTKVTLFNRVSLYGDYSYNSKQKSRYNISLNYNNDSVSVGAFYNKSFGGFVRYDFERIGLYISQSKITSFGLIIK